MRAIAVIFIFCIPSFASAEVFINEIAWMGTSDSSSNEWVELSNTGDTTDLNGWIFRIEGKKDIQLSGSVSSGGYYLIERTDDNTVPGVTADLINSFGGFLDSGAVLSLIDGSGKEQDRVNGSDGWKIGGGEVKGNKTTKETAQKGTAGWFTGAPTPRVVNAGVTSVVMQEQSADTAQTNTPTVISSFPVDPQIIADAGATTRTISVGAPITFTGRVFGLKKEPIENARQVWSFGDGSRAEVASVTHTYYYPGEYIVVLDTSSGYYSASDRVTVRVSTPLLALHTGGDTARSFVALENRGADEVDLSLWQVMSGEKTFILPQNTILGARKTFTLASEVSGLVTPTGSVIFINYPNGSRVELQTPITPSRVVIKEPINSTVKIKAKASVPMEVPQHQPALVLNALNDTQAPLPTSEENGHLWPWYIGAAFLGALALLGLRLTQKMEEKAIITAEDFEIIEETDDNEPH